MKTAKRKEIEEAAQRYAKAHNESFSGDRYPAFLAGVMYGIREGWKAAREERRDPYDNTTDYAHDSVEDFLKELSND